MVIAITIAFVLGYILIAVEGLTKVNKAAVALLMASVCWTLYAVGGLGGEELTEVLERNLGEAGTTIFFLMGAMTIVELVDSYGGFNFVKRALSTTSKVALFWRIALLTAIMSAVLDNLTTTIVMLMILGKIVGSSKDNLIYASMIVLSANAGGAFSPIGDVTTIMLWNGKMVTATGVILMVAIPSIVSFVVPGLILQRQLHGELSLTPNTHDSFRKKLPNEPRRRERLEVFIVGVGGLCLVPLFHTLTELPPFMGIICIVGLLWVLTDIIHIYVKKSSASISAVLGKIDMSTILFFLGILLSVSVLSEIGVLSSLGAWLNENIASDFLKTGIIGVLSAVVDNVPLVAGTMKMYPIADAAMVAADPSLAGMVQDGIFWQLLAYCAGVGGSLLIIGSAAGVVAMGIANISFGWYIKKISWVALIGYLCGIAAYAVQCLVLGLI
ncbi:MAG: sodium:proton antiporter NhaD [Bacteroidales bacterium]|nr:sodium:proton antiporter NhaD [Bacteroidales bacterium]